MRKLLIGLTVVVSLVFAVPVMAGNKDYPVKGDKPPGHTEQPGLPDHNNEGPPGCEPSGNQPPKCDEETPPVVTPPPVKPPVEEEVPPVVVPPVTPPVVTPPSVTPPAPPVVPPTPTPTPVAPPVEYEVPDLTDDSPDVPESPDLPKREQGEQGQTEDRRDRLNIPAAPKVQTRTVSSTEGDTLPYTGIPVGLGALLGASLMAGGAVMRRRNR